MHGIMLLDRLVLIVGILVYSGRRNWCRVVTSSEAVWVELVDTRVILVAFNDMRDGCWLMNNLVYYLMADRCRIGRVGILMQVFHMLFIRSVSSADIIVFYDLFFIMHLVCGMMLVFMRFKLLHPSRCLMRLLFRMCLYILCFALESHEVLIHWMQRITRVDQYSVFINWVKVLDQMCIVVDWDNSLMILLMSFFHCFFHCFDRLWSGFRCRSWDRSYYYGYVNWLLLFLFFLNRF